MPAQAVLNETVHCLARQALRRTLSFYAPQAKPILPTSLIGIVMLASGSFSGITSGR